MGAGPVLPQPAVDLDVEHTTASAAEVLKECGSPAIGPSRRGATLDARPRLAPCRGEVVSCLRPRGLIASGRVHPDRPGAVPTGRCAPRGTSMKQEDYSVTTEVDASPEVVFAAVNDVRGWWSQ